MTVKEVVGVMPKNTRVGIWNRVHNGGISFYGKLSELLQCEEAKNLLEKEVHFMSANGDNHIGIIYKEV